MAAAQNALRLTDTTLSVDMPQTPRTPRRTNVQSERFQQLAADWAAMDGTQKSAWNLLAQQTADALQPQAASTRVTAYTAFVAANTALLNTGAPALATAPAQHIIPTALPALTLTGTFLSSSLSLTLSAADAYTTAPVLIYAARPQLAGRGLYPSTDFSLIGVLPTLTIAAQSLAALYSAKFRVPSAGYQIALRLSPVSTTGYRRPPVTLTAVVTATGALTIE